MGGDLYTVGVCLGGYVCGLVLAQYFKLPPLPALFLFVPLIVLLACRRFNRYAPVLLLSCCLLSGLLRYPARMTPPVAAEVLAPLAGQGRVQLDGEVLAAHERPESGLALDIVLTCGARLRLHVERAEQTPPVGSRVVFRSRIRRVRNFGIPGEFDFVRHLAYRRIWYSAFLPDDRGLAVLAGTTRSLPAWIDQLRRTGLKRIDSAVTGEPALLLKALLLGEKGGMSSDLRRRLAGAGLAHLFAISGLHLGLLAVLLYVLLKSLYSRSTRLMLWQPPARALRPLLLVPLFLYLLLTGEGLATRRAFFALLVVILLGLLRRRTALVTLLCSLAFLFLLFEPLALWQPSFQLSFCGALGIALWSRPLMKLLSSWPRLVRYPAQLFAVSLAAFLATLPAVAGNFHLLAPAGLLTNLIAVPLVSFIALPLGLVALLLGYFWPVGSLPLLQAAGWLLQLLNDFSSRLAGWPGLAPRPLFLSLSEILALSLVCLGLLLAVQFRRALFLLLPGALLLVASTPAFRGPELYMFSVGQGEAMLLRSNGKNILIDGGGLNSPDFDVGERLLAPALGRLGVRSLDAVVLSHNHPDHSGGLAFVVDHFPVREFWCPDDPTQLPHLLREALQKRRVPVFRYVGSWQRLSPGGLQSLQLFAPQIAGAHENDRSLCLFLPTAAGGLLLTGDLEASGVDALLKQPLPGPVGLLKAPHHGSAGSKPAHLLAQLHPRVVLVSAGYRNVYHFPSRQLIEQASRQGIELGRTDRDGTLRMRVRGDRWVTEHWFKGLFR